MIDLHMHSTFSDGSFSPTELVEMACEKHLEAIALTDHDTFDGVDEFLAARASYDIQRITGVELSAEYSPGTMHILGYHIDIRNRNLAEKLNWIRGKRENRNSLILDRLNELGLQLTWKEIAEYAGSDVVGRPHFAQAMIARGYVKDKQEAFDKFLAKGKKAYINRARLDPKDCIELIKDAGGIPVLAHPVTLKLNTRKLRDKVEELVSYGLGGIECYYSEFTESYHQTMVKIAHDFDLVITGGTDFHGAINPRIHMGTGFGGMKIPNKLLSPLNARAGVGIDPAFRR